MVLAPVVASSPARRARRRRRPRAGSRPPPGGGRGGDAGGARRSRRWAGSTSRARWSRCSTACASSPPNEVVPAARRRGGLDGGERPGRARARRNRPAGDGGRGDARLSRPGADGGQARPGATRRRRGVASRNPPAPVAHHPAARAGPGAGHGAAAGAAPLSAWRPTWRAGRLPASRRPPRASLLFLWAYLAAEVVGLAALAAAVGREPRRPPRGPGWKTPPGACSSCWAGALFGAARVALRPAAGGRGRWSVRVAGPVIVLIRHASIVDNLLPASARRPSAPDPPALRAQARAARRPLPRRRRAAAAELLRPPRDRREREEVQRVGALAHGLGTGARAC